MNICSKLRYCIQSNYNDSNADDRFTMANSNSFSGPKTINLSSAE